MTTLRHALESTLRIHALEASLLQAIEGIQAVENTYVSPAEDVSSSRTALTFAADDSPGEMNLESIIRDRLLFTRDTEEPHDWVATELDRPAVAVLSLLLMLYGADPDQVLPESGSAPIAVPIDRDRARRNVPSEYRVVIDDLFMASDLTPDGYFPERFTAHVTVNREPLYIAEVHYTNAAIPATFSLELHPTHRRDIAVPA